MDKHLDNECALDAVLVHPRGRPKGSPKPLNSGRKKGTPNKVTQSVREAALVHGPKALGKLVKLISNPDPRVSLAAAREVLDRAYGRPVTPAAITSAVNDKPEAEELSILELARLTVFLLSKAEQEVDKTAARPALLRKV